MVEVKKNRELETREKQVLKDYKPASSLPDPNPEPGYRYRYIMTHILGKSDAIRLSRMRRDGWEPVKASDHPELMLEASPEGNVEIGGLILCKNTEENIAAYDRFYAKQAKDQMESVDNSFMKDNDPRMRKFSEKYSEVTRGRGLNANTK